MTKIKFDGMWAVGKLTAQCLEDLSKFIEPGMVTQDIDDFVKRFQDKNHLTNAQYQYDFKGRMSSPFPGYCCTSVNHVICHGIPSKTKLLRKGDIVKVDITFINEDGWHGDSCRTFEVGTVPVKAQKVSDAARSALYMGIAKCYPGNTVGDIARTIDGYIRSINMSVVPDFTGHGIGLKFHEAPYIPHWFSNNLDHLNKYVLKVGDTFTIEPMVNIGGPEYKMLNDGWTIVTRDKSLSAQWEHTIGISEEGPVVFTAL